MAMPTAATSRKRWTKLASLSRWVIWPCEPNPACRVCRALTAFPRTRCFMNRRKGDRKSTRLNSSHLVISYAVFCLKKKKNRIVHYTQKRKVIEREEVTDD